MFFRTPLITCLLILEVANVVACIQNAVSEIRVCDYQCRCSKKYTVLKNNCYKTLQAEYEATFLEKYIRRSSLLLLDWNFANIWTFSQIFLSILTTKRYNNHTEEHVLVVSFDLLREEPIEKCPVKKIFLQIAVLSSCRLHL